MSGLVEKVREVVRSRSKGRLNDSTNSAKQAPIDSSDQYVLAPETSNPRNGRAEIRREQDVGNQSGLEGTTRSFARMNVNEPYNTTTSTTTTSGTQVTTYPLLTNNPNENFNNARAQDRTTSGPSRGERPLTGNMTTPRAPIHRRNISSPTGDSGNPTMSAGMIPDRESSMQRKPLPPVNTSTDTAARDREVVNHPRGPRSPTGLKQKRNVDVAPNDPSPLIPHFTARSVASPTSPTLPLQSRKEVVTGNTQDNNLRLPANFDLSNSERTHVEVKIAPAVTAEKIQVQRMEVVTQAVHKDIHVDHHYTYIQPIPVVEILPARHFRLDPTTGVKTEIPAPPGYKLPAHLEPRKAEDYSHLKRTTRHYVVDEEHPNGQLEPPPRHEDDVADMQGQQNNY